MAILKEYITLPIGEIKPYENNPRINDDAVAGVVESIKQCGELDPIEVDENNIILSGHTRLKAYNQLGYDKVSVLRVAGLTEPQKRKYRLLTNKTGEVAAWDIDKLELELEGLDFDGFDFGFDVDLPSLEEDDQKEVVEDDYDEEPPTEPKAKLGDLWQLGNYHRLICGDSTDPAVIDRLMDGVKADLVFTDPPYGMKKESEGVLNDNLNYDDLLDFNRQWIPLTFGALKDNGSWYCWGIDEPLMDIYSNILKPMAKENKITFRNLITWDKGNGQGQLSKDYRMYPIADEKCLFVMMGVQDMSFAGFTDSFDSIRNYLIKEKDKLELTKKELNKLLGRCASGGGMASHYFGEKVGQFSLPTRDMYNKLKKYANENNIKAFEKEYEQLRKEYEQLRAYFDNTHDNMNNVWHFDRAGKDEREHTGGHATPKPIALCSRAIKSSSREGEIVLDVFGGSGSTLIACEQLNRKCYMVELSPEYIDVIINRWEKFTGQKAVKL